MADVFANGRSILHKGDGNTHVSAPPDVCKVPTPGGPVPTPFVNSAQDSMLDKGSQTTTIEGHPIALADSELSVSSGDEPGTAGGLVSSKFKGKMAWSAVSTDVKVEGKGVARFLDPTLHNGNTFNICFISRGGTGLAYGDDAKCPACGQAGRKHRVLETPLAKGAVGAIFLELDKRLKEQKPLIEQHRKLRAKRKALTVKSEREANAASLSLKPKEMQKQQLMLLREQAIAQKLIAKLQEIGPQIHKIDGELKPEYDKIKEMRRRYKAEIDKISQEMNRINEEIDQKNPVLDLNDQEGTFVDGYMVGACICKCVGKEPKMLAARSGASNAAFKTAASAAGFEPVAGFRMSSNQQAHIQMVGRAKWECAAPQLLSSGRAGGHNVKTMSERLYAPEARPSPSVRYKRTDTKGTRKREEQFSHGDSVPSCKECQKLIPEMLCYNRQECS
ncbi:DUF4150 domain-containing protein [Hyalangium minutum]|uniref:Tox-PAAR-like domain-containing protein n=1 Tax=Hyalangium minutum TaxID=394096 RepID=A0A085W048_9BACT|nr:DUF4150 domain-containing protein [Hyalangium minutum]KFE61061.1 hypothetical protein DB31_4496 [Hyalangium minutum]